ncbi:hypothetical protein MKX01_009894 [Papaver californicum]|nr:hypothetical protein MKX01_009894 [Papaver californicum]
MHSISPGTDADRNDDVSETFILDSVSSLDISSVEDIFTDSELSKLRNYINDLRHASHSGELSRDTFIFFNQQLKGNKRELIQLGVPIFGQIRDEKTKSGKSNIEPIPSVLQAVIDHLSQWHLIPENRKQQLYY